MDPDHNEWLKEKYSLGLKFPNVSHTIFSKIVIFLQLPYYIDGDVKLTQSSAILYYIADKYGMGMYNC